MDCFTCNLVNYFINQLNQYVQINYTELKNIWNAIEKMKHLATKLKK